MSEAKRNSQVTDEVLHEEQEEDSAERQSNPSLIVQPPTNTTQVEELISRLTQFENKVVVERLTSLESDVSSLKKELVLIKLMVKEIKTIVNSISITQEQMVSDMDEEQDRNLDDEPPSISDLLSSFSLDEDEDQQQTGEDSRVEYATTAEDAKKWN